MSGLDERLERSVQLSVTHITWQTDAITFLFGFFFFFFLYVTELLTFTGLMPFHSLLKTTEFAEACEKWIQLFGGVWVTKGSFF